MKNYTHVVYASNTTPDFCDSLEEAAITKLGHDGHEWDIHPAEDGDGWELWGSQFSCKRFFKRLLMPGGADTPISALARHGGMPKTV